MTERMEAEPGRELAGPAETSPELDLTTLPWLVPDDAAPDEIDTPAPSTRPKPPPRRTVSAPESAMILGGAVAGAAATSPGLPRRIVATPKRRAITPAEALPSVLIPNATLPPRGRGEDHGGELAAEPLADDRGHRRVRPTRALIAVGALTLAGLAAAGAARLRGRDDPPLPYSPPAFVNEAAPSDPPQPPATDTAPSIAALGGARSPDAAALPAPAAPPPPATGELVPQDMPMPEPSPPHVADTPAAALVSSAPVAAVATPRPSSEHGAAGKTSDAEASVTRTAPTTTPHESTSPRSRHGRRRELAAPQVSPAAPSRAPTTSGGVDPITTYTFASDELFRVRAAPKRVTDLILQPGEKLATRPTVGDASLWIIHVIDAVHGDEPQQHVQVTPLRVDTTTNLTLTTNRRNYHLELLAGSGAYMAAVQWRYPEHDAERRRQELERLTRERQSSTRVADAKALRFDYSIRNTSGKPSWRPTMVFDDGSQTFIRFPGGVCPDPLPMLFVVRTGSTQNAEYVNYRVRGDLYVVDRVVDAVELRLPSKDADDAQQVVLIQRSAH